MCCATCWEHHQEQEGPARRFCMNWSVLAAIWCICPHHHCWGTAPMGMCLKSNPSHQTTFFCWVQEDQCVNNSNNRGLPCTSPVSCRTTVYPQSAPTDTRIGLAMVSFHLMCTLVAFQDYIKVEAPAVGCDVDTRGSILLKLCHNPIIVVLVLLVGLAGPAITRRVSILSTIPHRVSIWSAKSIVASHAIIFQGPTS